MSWQAKRNANAAAAMRAAGIPIPSGKSAYSVWRKLSPETRAGAITARARTDTSYRAGGSMASITRAPRGGPRKAVDLPGERRVIQTGSKAVAVRELRSRPPGDRVVIRATFQTDAGDWRTRTLTRAAAGAAIGDEIEPGPRPGRIDSHVRGTPRGRTLVEFSMGDFGDGIDIGEFLEWLGDNDDIDMWDAIHALWESAYS